ncbi:MAG: hypothetical protein KBD01_16740, partial [Acidobacteria bacterium]|nr:hypothetical protein [Acidobacteriota bacterium]
MRPSQTRFGARIRKHFLPALLAAACGTFGLAAPREVPRLATESAGPGGSVAGTLAPRAGVAGVVLWPGPAVLETQGLSPGSAAAAAHAAVDAVLAAEPGWRPLVEVLPEAVAVGAMSPEGDGERLARILVALASPRTPGANEEVEALLDAQGRRSSERWDDALEVSRQAVLGLAFPSFDGPWSGWPPPGVLAELDRAGIEAVLANVRRAPVRARVAGPPGLAERVAVALGGRLGSAAPPPAAEDPAPLPAGLVVTRDAREDDTVGLALAFRFSAAEARQHAAALEVLAEALRVGEGSLRQRLDVTVGKDAACKVEVEPAGSRGGALVLRASVPSGNALAAWQVVEGSVSSVRSMPLREDALMRARQRLDARAEQARRDAGVIVLDSLRQAVSGWPPEDRWSRPPAAQDVREFATTLITPERRAAALAGPLFEALPQIEVLKGVRRVGWSQFDPTSGDLARADTFDAVDREKGQVLARETLLALSGGRPIGLETAYHARYDVSEDTPAGVAESVVVLASGPAGATMTVESGKWTLEAQEKDAPASEPILPGGGGDSPEVAPNGRLEAISCREPAVFLARVLSGAVGAAAVESACGAPE